MEIPQNAASDAIFRQMMKGDPACKIPLNATVRRVPSDKDSEEDEDQTPIGTLGQVVGNIHMPVPQMGVTDGYLVAFEHREGMCFIVDKKIEFVSNASQHQIVDSLKDKIKQPDVVELARFEINEYDVKVVGSAKGVEGATQAVLSLARARGFAIPEEQNLTEDTQLYITKEKNELVIYSRPYQP